MQIQFWKTLTRYYLPHMAHVRPFWTILEMCWLLSYRFGVSISLRSGLRFWKVYFLSGRGMERVQTQFLICRSFMGAGWAGVGTILRLSLSNFGRVSTILRLCSGICCFYFGLGHFLVVEVWFRWPGFWSWAFQGCWVLALFVFTLDLGHFSVVKFWVLAQRCQRKQYIHTKNCNSLLAALLMFQH